ncbi:malate dehydrogenase [Elysia marginata]|uniref:Malate dehydrogenase n=1 Tax=Elysia marginata TaxID=1093978 RepID=A0AAV4EKZ0_9GAST|nr:malate dehydrogenase [Elysia marginata]
MWSNKDLTVLLCVENVDDWDILLNQLGSGEVFGPNQRLSLILQGCDQSQLEALSWDLQDCAFPLISGVSTCTVFANAGLQPDAVMVLLTNRLSNKTEKQTGHVRSCLNNLNLERDYDLLGLVNYTKSIAEKLADCNLNNARIVMLGDIAHVAASLFSSYLPTPLGAVHIIALDGMEGILPRQLAHNRGQMSKVTRFCHALRQLWSGQQVHQDKRVELGTKFVDTKQNNVNRKPTGYFFSGSVNLTGPATFSTRLAFDSNLNHMAKVKAETDAAIALAATVDGVKNDQDFLSYQVAHL